MKKFHVKMLGLAAVVLVSASASAQLNVGANTAPNSTLQVTGSEARTITAITVNTILNNTHNTVIVANGITVTLPPTSSLITGRTYTIRIASGASSATVAIPSGINLIVKDRLYNSGSPLVLSFGESVTLVCDGTKWYAINNDISGANIVMPASGGSTLYPSYIDANGNQVSGLGGTNGISVGRLQNFSFINVANTPNALTAFENGYGAWEITVKSQSSDATGGQQFNTSIARFLYMSQNNTVINSLRYIDGNSNMASTSGNVNPSAVITTTDLAMPGGFAAGRNIRVDFPTSPASSITLAVGQATPNSAFVATSSANGALTVEVKKIM